MKDLLKFIMFLELIALFVCALTHLTIILVEGDDPDYYQIYWIIPSIIFIVALFTKLIIVPLANWWFE